MGRENQEGREEVQLPPTDPRELLGKQQFAASRQKAKTCSLEDSYAILLPKRTQVWRSLCPEVLERMAYFLQGDRPNLTPDLSKSHRLSWGAMPHTWVGPRLSGPGHSALLGATVFPQCPWHHDNKVGWSQRFSPSSQKIETEELTQAAVWRGPKTTLELGLLEGLTELRNVTSLMVTVYCSERTRVKSLKRERYMSRVWETPGASVQVSFSEESHTGTVNASSAGRSHHKWRIHQRCAPEPWGSGF